ncbi:dibenzothiophene desulfurization enzyme C [Mycolicibacterium conceptionense]|uniref:Dibenzothiophene desulfurization enzyme C n=1 Tax=Mycolicibacterium conceptionense TaxID=451644 RepID=A0A0U1DCN5_9MYCO|nr:dibenzothiophene desulfurization enzyme C [Mycolicibacterium conceptionense]
MRRTDSGTTEFHNVAVRPDEVLGKPNAILEAFLASGRGSCSARSCSWCSPRFT